MMGGTKLQVPRAVWVLGLVSLFMDLSSEIIHALLPLFMTATLGLSVAMVGMVDGIAEATASITKVFSGRLSDLSGRRKPLMLLGYGLGAASKPLFPLAAGVWPVLGARFADRIGKGLRGAPRDALVADVTPPQFRGRAFGLRQSLDTVGAFAGPLLAIGLMLALGNDMRLVFWIAVIPALIAVALVVFGVKEPANHAPAGRASPAWRDVRLLGGPFWKVAAIGVLFSLGRISEAFLILRAHSAGLPIALAPLVLVAMNLVYSLGAYPAGILSDSGTPRRLLGCGIVAVIAADLVLAFATGLTGVFIGVGLWGVHMALTQGILARLVADTAPADLRGSAFGVFSLLAGAALLIASVLAGLLWDAWGSQVTFAAAAGFSALSGVLLIAFGGGRTRPARMS
ncbi:MAG: MFS transporter [Croceibacterium sp.]